MPPIPCGSRSVKVFDFSRLKNVPENLGAFSNPYDEVPEIWGTKTNCCLKEELDKWYFRQEQVIHKLTQGLFAHLDAATIGNPFAGR